jgi:basic membrane lipoprotein Med (substrate-binding protein (PBP1-ABC) superfamily)
MENFSEQNSTNKSRVVRLGIVIVIAFTAVIALLAGFRAMSAQASIVKVGLITGPGPLNDTSGTGQVIKGYYAQKLSLV